MTFNTTNSFVRGRLVGLLLIGILLLFFAGQQLLTICTSKSALIALKGTLQSCDTYVTTVSSKYRGYETKSQKAELIFYITEVKMKFALRENIGSNYTHHGYEEMKKKLNRADSITVWVKKNESDYWEPQIFQIETDREMVLNFASVRFNDLPLTAFLLLMALGCIVLPVYAFYPGIFGKKQAVISSANE